MMILGIFQCILEKDVILIIVFMVTKYFWNQLLVHNQNIRYFALRPQVHLLSQFPIKILGSCSITSQECTFPKGWDMDSWLDYCKTQPFPNCFCLPVHWRFLWWCECSYLLLCLQHIWLSPVHLFCLKMIRTWIECIFLNWTVGSVTSTRLVVTNSWRGHIIQHIATFRQWLTCCWALVKMLSSA